MLTVCNFGDIIKFYDENNLEMLGIITGAPDDGQAFSVSTLSGKRYLVPPDKAIITMSNYFDSPSMQKTLRDLSSVAQ